MIGTGDVTRYSTSEVGLLLPAESLALLGAGPEGALAIREYGWPSGDFDREFDALVSRLEERGDEDALLELAVAQNIVGIARQARGWLSITATPRNLVAPTIVLLAGEMLLAARLHGEVIEIVSGSPELVGRAVRSITDLLMGEVLVTGFSGGVARCGAHIYGSVVDVSARQDDRLARLTAAASRSLDELMAQLVKESIE